MNTESNQIRIKQRFSIHPDFYILEASRQGFIELEKDNNVIIPIKRILSYDGIDRIFDIFISTNEKIMIHLQDTSNILLTAYRLVLGTYLYNGIKQKPIENLFHLLQLQIEPNSENATTNIKEIVGSYNEIIQHSVSQAIKFFISYEEFSELAEELHATMLGIAVIYSMEGHEAVYKEYPCLLDEEDEEQEEIDRKRNTVGGQIYQLAFDLRKAYEKGIQQVIIQLKSQDLIENDQFEIRYIYHLFSKISNALSKVLGKIELTDEDFTFTTIFDSKEIREPQEMADIIIAEAMIYVSEKNRWLSFKEKSHKELSLGDQNNMIGKE